MHFREHWPLWLAALALLGQMTAQLAAGDLGDLPVFLGAAERLQSGASPYLTWIPTRNGDALQFVYPPLAAWVFTPLTWISTNAAYLLWSLLRIGLALRTLHLLFGLASSLNARHRVLFQVVLLAVFLRFALDDLALGQWTIVLLFCAMEGSHRLQRGHERAAAFLLAFGAALKLLPLTLLFGLLLMRKWRAAGWSIGFGVLLTALPMVQFGPTRFAHLVHDWTLSISPAHNPDVADTGGNNPGIQGLSGMLPVYLQIADEPGVALNIIDMSDAHLAIVLNILRLGLLGIALLLWTRVAKHDPWPLYAYLLLITPLILPHQQAYAFLFATPAVAVVLSALLSPSEHGARSRSAAVLLVAAIALLLGSAHVFLGNAGYAIAQQAKLITWGSLLLIPALLLVGRRLTCPSRT